jgi:hypothetical protein
MTRQGARAKTRAPFFHRKKGRGATRRSFFSERFKTLGVRNPNQVKKSKVQFCHQGTKTPRKTVRKLESYLGALVPWWP